MIDFSKYIIKSSASVREALVALNNLSNDVLTLFVVDSANKMIGTLTDGDIRRKLIEGISLDSPIEIVMNRNYKFLREKELDVLKIKKFREKNITLIPYLTYSGEILKIFNLKNRKSVLPIDAVLMAGGRGVRLRPLTENTPKPLLKIGDKAIIDYNIDRLLLFGIENIFVTVNYLKEQLEEHFKRPREGIKIKCIREPEFLGTIGSVKFINDFQNNDVLVMNSDLFTNIDYEDFYIHFKKHNADISIAAIPYSLEIPYGVFDLEGRKVQGIKEKPTYNYYANAGIYLIKRELLKHIPDNRVFNATDLIELLLNKGFNVIRYPITGYWIDIGKFEEYIKAKELARHL